jgi:release factor glutamine methyltransferase
VTLAVSAALDAAVARLAAAGIERPREEALRLLALALGTDRGGVLARRPDALPPALEASLDRLLARRASREPLQYLTGEQEFRGLAMAVDGRVLIPRPETEEVVDAVLALDLPAGGAVADLGTGSGCIAIALKVARPDLTVLALDRSPEALQVARANAGRHGVAVTFEEGDFALPPVSWNGSLDAVVSNPPYVSQEEWEGLAPEVRLHEPRVALVPGESGLEAYRALVPAATRLLAPGGFLLLELGWRSSEPVRALAAAAGFREVEVRNDLRGIPRILCARWGGP